jgi:hypothetical protein
VEPDAGLVGAHNADLWQLNILLFQLAPCLLEDGIHNLLGRHTAHPHSSCEKGNSGLVQSLQQGSLIDRDNARSASDVTGRMKQVHVRNVALGGAAAGG